MKHTEVEIEEIPIPWGSRPWRVTFKTPGAERFFEVPYEGYARLCKVAISSLDQHVVEALVTGEAVMPYKS